jgi:hypothetical protein
MSQDEVGAIMKTRFKLKVEDIKMSWEQTRIITFYNAVCSGSIKAKTAQEFMPFDWDKPEKKKEIPRLSRDEIDRRLKELMESKKLRSHGQN